MKISKFLVGSAVALAMALPFVANAATFTNIRFPNGDVTTSVTGGSTVNGTARLVVGVGEVVENIQTDLLGDSLAPVCNSVNGDLGYQEGTYDNVPFSIQASPNTGTYTLELRGAGIFGGVRSISCSDGVVSTNSFSNAVRVVASGSTSSSTASASDMSLFAQFMAFFMAHPPVATAPAPTVSAECSALSLKLVGTADNTYNSANVKLQGLLLADGQSIPALAAGASFGYKGPQTRAAVTAYVIQHNCN